MVVAAAEALAKLGLAVGVVVDTSVAAAVERAVGEGLSELGLAVAAVVGVVVVEQPASSPHDSRARPQRRRRTVDNLTRFLHWQLVSHGPETFCTSTVGSVS